MLQYLLSFRYDEGGEKTYAICESTMPWCIRFLLVPRRNDNAFYIVSLFFTPHNDFFQGASWWVLTMTSCLGNS
jgi:hypothetical protein